MKIKNIYSPEVLKMFRLLSVLGFLAELFYLIRAFYQMNFVLNLSNISSLEDFFASPEGLLISNFLCIIVFIYLFFLPQHIEVIAILAFYFSFVYMFTPSLGKKPLGTALYLLGVSSCILRGYYRKHTRIKIYLTLLTYAALILIDLRISFSQFIDSLIDSLGYLMSYALSLVFFVHFLKSTHENAVNKIWDLSQYPELTERDKLWISQILKDKRYEDIAKESGITIGTLKNRMHQIFTIIGLPDRVSLLATYSGYQLKF